eukprot:240341-Chlamydomonas_euryale.AAC.11
MAPRSHRPPDMLQRSIVLTTSSIHGGPILQHALGGCSLCHLLKHAACVVIEDEETIIRLSGHHQQSAGSYQTGHQARNLCGQSCVFVAAAACAHAGQADSDSMLLSAAMEHVGELLGAQRR